MFTINGDTLYFSLTFRPTFWLTGISLSFLMAVHVGPIHRRTITNSTAYFPCGLHYC